MKQKLALFILIIVTLMIAACNERKNDQVNLVLKDSLLYEINSEKPFTGTQKAKVNNNYMEYEVVDGMKQGEFKIFYEDGTIQMSGSMDKNKNVGKWQYFFQEGKIESEGNFENDSPNGLWHFYYQDGKLKEEGYFKNGFRMGEWQFYNDNGNKDSSKVFEISDSSFAVIDSLRKIN